MQSYRKTLQQWWIKSIHPGSKKFLWARPANWLFFSVFGKSWKIYSKLCNFSSNFKIGDQKRSTKTEVYSRLKKKREMVNFVSIIRHDSILSLHIIQWVFLYSGVTHTPALVDYEWEIHPLASSWPFAISLVLIVANCKIQRPIQNLRIFSNAGNWFKGEKNGNVFGYDRLQVLFVRVCGAWAL